jgi:hypothetical protein
MAPLKNECVKASYPPLFVERMDKNGVEYTVEVLL